MSNITKEDVKLLVLTSFVVGGITASALFGFIGFISMINAYAVSIGFFTVGFMCIIVRDMFRLRERHRR